MTTRGQESGEAQGHRGALAGLRVLELGDFIAGPYCARLMADLGADVVKVEPPEGDSARRWGPFPDDVPDPERSGLFLYLNLGKRGITLDADDPAGHRILDGLVAWADALVTNWPARRLETLALAPRSLLERHPRLVVTTVLPFGWDSPYRDYRATPLTTFVASGVASRIGLPEEGPLAVPLSVAEYLGGISAAGATMLALIARQTSGRGQHVDIAQADTLAALVMRDVPHWQVSGDFKRRTGRTFVPFNTTLFCRDGSIHLICHQQNWWEALMDMMGHPEWAREPQFATRATRRRATAEVQDLFEAMVQSWVGDYDRADLFRMAREHSLNLAPYNNAPEVLEMDHLQERGSFVEVEVPGGGQARLPLPPYHLSATPGQYTRPAPRLGEHSQEILCDLLGYHPADLCALRRLGVA